MLSNTNLNSFNSIKNDQVISTYQDQQINSIQNSYALPFREPSNTLPLYNSNYNEKLNHSNVLSNNYTIINDNNNFPFNNIQNNSTIKVNENVNNNLTNEIEMNLICGEYLKYANYTSTLNEFEVECKKRGLYHDFQKDLHSKDVDNNKKNEIYNLLLNFFHQGNRNGFMDIWLKILPDSTRQVDTIAQKLEFNLNVYFAIYPIHDYVDLNKSITLDINTTMMEFKKYLENNSTKLSQSQQCIPFYALPYIPNPKNHSLFKETFTEQWVLNLQDQLKLFINSLLNTSQKPRLYTLLQGNKVDKSTKEKDYLLEIENYKNEISNFKMDKETIEKKFSNLKNDYKNLVSISSELVKIINASMNGEQILPSFINDIYRQIAIFQQKNMEDYDNDYDSVKISKPISNPSIYGNNNEVSKDMSVNPMLLSPLYDKSGRINSNTSNTLFKTNSILSSNLNQPFQKIRLDSETQNPSLLMNHEFQKVPYQNQNERVISWINESDINKDFIHFNYHQIINDLKNLNDDQNLVKLIQALRLNLSRAHSNGKRREILSTYIQNDILDIKNKTTPNVITRLLKYSSEVVHIQLFKLLNIICTDSIGREYLIGFCSNIIENLITILFSFKTFTDSIFFKNILAVLQKLSLRRKAQSLMIKENLIEFITEFLGTNENSNNYISEETLEYCIALLMNLCLRTEGKRRCCHRSKEILKILNNHIEHDNQQIKTYINGTLYNLFTEHIIREQAKSMGMPDLLQYLISVSDIQIKKQLEFVLEQLNSDEIIDNYDLISEDGEEDDKEDLNDNEIPEIDENLVINDLAEDENEEFGYELLHKKYPVNNSLKQELKQMIPTSPEKEYVKDEVFKRTNVTVAKAKPKNNYQSSINNNGIIINNIVTNATIDNTNIQNDNDLNGSNYKSFITKDTTPHKTQQTPIIKNKRHNKKPTNEDYIKMQTIKPHPPLESVMKKVKEKTGISSEEELKEYYQAFTSNPRIARTPVESISLNSISTTSKSTLPDIRQNSSFNRS